ncbi:hypothetical protein ACFL02_08245 [Planctomycetota bacterium]
MYGNKDPTSNCGFLFHNRPRRFHSLDPDPELLALEKEVRQRNLIYQPEVRILLQIATLGNEANSRWAREKLLEIIEADRIMDFRTGDVFRPLAPLQLISQGDLHLLTQVDKVDWMIPRNALTRGMLLTGPQGGGKTRLLIWICKKLSQCQSPVPLFILDPKQELKDCANYLNATYVEIEDIRIDLSPPPGITYTTWLTALCPQIGEIIGVIYGVEVLQQAATICIDQREKYIQQTGSNIEICLNDLFLSVPFVPETSTGRRAGYREAVTTGLARILRGSGELFKCRKGIDLSTLFQQHNVIVGCRSLTDEFATKLLAFYLLWYLHELERFSPATDELRRVLILDDATRFLAARSGFEAASGTSNFSHAYATLRSSGNGIITVTQIPHLADPGILALSHTVVCVGGLHYGEDTKILAQVMGLTEEQRIALSRLAQREAVGICAGSAWPKPVHGFTPEVTI